jgi:predicted nucleotidyltransferase
MGDPEAMVAQEKISEAARILAQVARPQKIILFGSYGRGAPREDSDVDLQVVEAEVEDRAVEMTRLNRALSPLRISVDLLVVSREMFEYWATTPGNVYFDAIREGKVLYEAA